MKFNYVLGVDVSKEWLNFCLMDGQMAIIEEWEIDNSIEKIESFFLELFSYNELSISELIVVMEHTGIYVQHLTKVCLLNQIAVCLEHASNITEHILAKNYVEEKNDAMDARRIAEYGIRFQDKIKLYEPSDQTIINIKRLSSQRKRLIKALNVLKVPLQESKEFDCKTIYKTLSDNQSTVIKELNKAIKRVEKQIDQCIQEDQLLKKIYRLVISVSGVGPVTAREFIVKTEGFTKFKETEAKAFSRYTAVVPVSKQSGKKKGKARTPKRKNNSLKSLLTMGALSLIESKSDLGNYYRRKIQEGKEHLVVINNMRNKIILRVFAVVRNNNIYNKNYQLS